MNLSLKVVVSLWNRVEHHHCYFHVLWTNLISDIALGFVCQSWTDLSTQRKSTPHFMKISFLILFQFPAPSLQPLLTYKLYVVYNLAAISLGLIMLFGVWLYFLVQIMVEYNGKASPSLPHCWAPLRQRIFLTALDHRHFTLEKSGVITISIS